MQDWYSQLFTCYVYQIPYNIAYMPDTTNLVSFGPKQYTWDRDSLEQGYGNIKSRKNWRRCNVIYGNNKTCRFSGVFNTRLQLDTVGELGDS